MSTTKQDSAVTAAQHALAERARLEALRAELQAGRPQQEAAHAAALQEADAAEAEALLASDGKQAPRRAETARATAQEVKMALRRTDAAMRALPARMAEADAAIEASAADLEALFAERTGTALEGYAEELAGAVQQLAAVLMKGHAIRAAAGNLRDHLDGVQIPALRFGEAHFIRAGVAQINGKPVVLSEAWPDDEAAASAFAELMPLRRISDQLARHRERIGRDRDEQRLAGDRETQARRAAEAPLSSNGGPPPAPRNPADWKPSAGAGPLRSYEVREPGTPVPQEASIGGKLLEQALPTDHENRPWPQSAEAAARLAGHR